MNPIPDEHSNAAHSGSSDVRPGNSELALATVPINITVGGFHEKIKLYLDDIEKTEAQAQARLNKRKAADPSLSNVTTSHNVQENQYTCLVDYLLTVFTSIFKGLTVNGRKQYCFDVGDGTALTKREPDNSIIHCKHGTRLIYEGKRADFTQSVIVRRGRLHPGLPAALLAMEGATIKILKQLSEQAIHVLKDPRNKNNQSVACLTIVGTTFSILLLAKDTPKESEYTTSTKPASQVGFQSIVSRARAQHRATKQGMAFKCTVHVFCEEMLQEDRTMSPVFARALIHAKAYKQPDELLKEYSTWTVPWWVTMAERNDARRDKTKAIFGQKKVDAAWIWEEDEVHEQVIDALTTYDDEDIRHQEREAKKDAEDSDFDVSEHNAGNLGPDSPTASPEQARVTRSSKKAEVATNATPTTPARQGRDSPADAETGGLFMSPLTPMDSDTSEGMRMDIDEPASPTPEGRNEGAGGTW